MKRVFVLILAALAALWPTYLMAQEELPEAPEVPPAPVSSSLLDGIMTMSNESLIMLVAGVVLSLVFAVVERQSWSSDAKALAFFLVCTLFGLIYSLAVDDDFSAGNVGRRILVTLAAGTIFYLAFRKPIQTLEARSDGWLGGGKTPAA